MNQCDSALFLDARDTYSAVGAGARQHDGHSAFPVHFRQRAEEQVNRHMRAPEPLGFRQVQVVIVHEQVVRGRYHINMITLDGGVLHHLAHCHGGRALQDGGCIAFMLGRQVNDDHKSHAAVCWHGFKKPQQGDQTTCRGAYAHYRKAQRTGNKPN